MLTASSSSIARSRAARPRAMPCTISVSSIWLPMVKTGFRAVIGSWNTSAISAPRTFCISRSSSVRRSRPLNTIVPPAIRPGRCTRRRIDSAVTDLPLPDSPTRHSVSPAATWKLTSMTAGADPPRGRKQWSGVRPEQAESEVARSGEARTEYGASSTSLRCSTRSSASDLDPSLRHRSPCAPRTPRASRRRSRRRWRAPRRRG